MFLIVINEATEAENNIRTIKVAVQPATRRRLRRTFVGRMVGNP